MAKKKKKKLQQQKTVESSSVSQHFLPDPTTGTEVCVTALGSALPAHTYLLPTREGEEEKAFFTPPVPTSAAPQPWKYPDTVRLLATCSGSQDPSRLFLPQL